MSASRRHAAGRVAGLAAIALVAISAGSCRTEAPPGTGPGVVRLPISSDISGTDFARASDATTLAVRQLVSEPLVTFDQRLRARPAAAGRWTWSGDHTVLTFELRDGLTWHDGQPVTAADVVHTWEIERDPSRGSPNRAAGFNLIESVTAIDDRTVAVKYERPFAPALSTWATAPLVAKHVAADADPPVGCGRYRLESWVTGERLTLTPYAAHPDVEPGAPDLVLEVVPDYATQLAALRAGRVDAAPLIPATWQELRGDDDFMSRHEVLEYRILYYWFLAWRADGSNPFFSDARVRRAMTHAIDRRGYYERLGGGDRAAITSFHPDTWAFHDELEPWPFDPPRARELLDESGWSDTDGDGIRDRGGTPFRFALVYAGSSVETEKIAAYVQQALRDVGVEMTLEPLEFPVLVERLGERSFAAAMSGMRLDPDPDPFDLWHSTQADVGTNYSGLRDADVDAWIETARETIDQPERQRLYHRVQERLHELEPVTVFFYPTSRLAVADGLENVSVGPLGPLHGRPGPETWRASR